MMKQALLLLIGLTFTLLASAELSLESRNGMTHLHSEGQPIARYLSENRLSYTKGSATVTLLGNVYGTQNWAERVNKEKGWMKVDAVRYEYGAEIEYEMVNGFSLYTRHTMPVDRSDTSIGDGWNLHSYRWDSGFVYRKTW